MVCISQLVSYSNCATGCVKLRFPVGTRNLPLVKSVQNSQKTQRPVRNVRAVFHRHAVTIGAYVCNLHTALRLTVSGVVTPLPHTPSWRAQELDFQALKTTSLTIDNKNSNRNTLNITVALRAVWNLIPLHSPPPDFPGLYFHTINLESIFSIFVKDPLPVGKAMWRAKDSQVECWNH